MGHMSLPYSARCPLPSVQEDSQPQGLLLPALGKVVALAAPFIVTLFGIRRAAASPEDSTCVPLTSPARCNGSGSGGLPCLLVGDTTKQMYNIMYSSYRRAPFGTWLGFRPNDLRCFVDGAGTVLRLQTTH